MSFFETLQKHKTEAIFSVVFIVYIIVSILLFRHDPYDIVSTFPVTSAMLTLFISFLFFMMIVFIKQRKKLFPSIPENKGPTKWTFLKKILGTFAGFSLVGVIIFLIFYLLSHTPKLSTTLTFTLNLLITFGFLALLYKFFIQIKGDKTYKLPTWMGLIKDVIFYIPCLIIGIIDYLRHQYDITTSSTWILLGLEIALIVTRVIIPFIFNKIILHDGVHLLRDPVFTTSERTIGTYDKLHKDKKDKYSYHYAISSWIYINPQPPSTSSAYNKKTSILNYGGKPNILYDGTTNTLEITTLKSRDKEEVVYKTNKLPFQRWNHLVINYDRGTLDIFINNEIVASVKNVVPYMTYDSLTVGAKPGIYGGVCNVVYFSNVLTRNKISYLYNTHKYLTPPVL